MSKKIIAIVAVATVALAIGGVFLYNKIQNDKVDIPLATSNVVSSDPVSAEMIQEQFTRSLSETAIDLVSIMQTPYPQRLDENLRPAIERNPNITEYFYVSDNSFCLQTLDWHITVASSDNIETLIPEKVERGMCRE